MRQHIIAFKEVERIKKDVDFAALHAYTFSISSLVYGFVISSLYGKKKILKDPEKFEKLVQFCCSSPEPTTDHVVSLSWFVV